MTLTQALNISGHATLHAGEATLHVFALREGNAASGAAKIRQDTPDGERSEMIANTPKDMHAAIGAFLRTYGEWTAAD